MSMVEELKACISRQQEYGDAETGHHWDVFASAAYRLIRDHGQALVEALADAERYRFIREHSYVEFTCDSPRNVYMTNEQFDSSVDLARTKAGAGESE